MHFEFYYDIIVEVSSTVKEVEWHPSNVYGDDGERWNMYIETLCNGMTFSYNIVH